MIARLERRGWGHGSGEIPRIASPMPCSPRFAASDTVGTCLTQDTETGHPRPDTSPARKNLAAPVAGAGWGLELNREHGSRAGAGGG